MITDTLAAYRPPAASTHLPKGVSITLGVVAVLACAAAIFLAVLQLWPACALFACAALLAGRGAMWSNTREALPQKDLIQASNTTTKKPPQTKEEFLERISGQMFHVTSPKEAFRDAQALLEGGVHFDATLPIQVSAGGAGQVLEGDAARQHAMQRAKHILRGIPEHPTLERPFEEVLILHQDGKAAENLPSELQSVDPGQEWEVVADFIESGIGPHIQQALDQLENAAERVQSRKAELYWLFEGTSYGWLLSSLKPTGTDQRQEMPNLSLANVQEPDPPVVTFQLDDKQLTISLQLAYQVMMTPIEEEAPPPPLQMRHTMEVELPFTEEVWSRPLAEHPFRQTIQLKEQS